MDAGLLVPFSFYDSRMEQFHVRCCLGNLANQAFRNTLEDFAPQAKQENLGATETNFCEAIEGTEKTGND